jgi:RimJ/RimL family protein N-acetyltransferase
MEHDVLQSDRLLLRPFSLDDASEVQRLAGNRAIADTTLNIPHPYEDGMAEEWISTLKAKMQSGEMATFAITRVEDGQLIGAIGLTIEAPSERAELGYWIGEPYWGRGYCSEAVALVVRHGFEGLRLNKIHACYFERNPSSGRVLEKTGMMKEGVARQHIKKHERFENLVQCSLLREDWMGD